MSLSLKDRIKAFTRAIKIVCDPNVDYINLMWQSKSDKKPEDAPVYDEDSKQTIYTHTFFMEGANPVNTPLTYMAHVAAKSNNIDDLNARAEFYLNKVAVAYTLLNPSQEHVLQYISQPIRCVAREEAFEEEGN